MPDPNRTPALDATHDHALVELPLWDRAPNMRREDDRKLFVLLVTIIASTFAVGAAWATASAKVAEKLDRSEQVQVDLRQDRDLDSLRFQTRAVLDALRGVQVGIDAANVRLRDIACEGKPRSCR